MVHKERGNILCLLCLMYRESLRYRSFWLRFLMLARSSRASSKPHCGDVIYQKKFALMDVFCVSCRETRRENQGEGHVVNDTCCSWEMIDIVDRGCSNATNALIAFAPEAVYSNRQDGRRTVRQSTKGRGQYNLCFFVSQTCRRRSNPSLSTSNQK